MSISYIRLFHLLLDRGIKEGDFARKAGISAPTLAKLRTGKTITTEIIERICKSLNVQPADIMVYVPDDKEM
jgi:DNA-binding Xre family transcriptional regulator